MTVGTPTVGTQTEKTVATGTTISPPYPTTNAGEYMILAVAVRSGTVPTTPAGWTTLKTNTNAGTAGQPSSLLAGKTATGSESGNLTVTIPAVTAQAQIWSVPGVDTTNPINASSTHNNTTGTSSLNVDGITTVSDGCLLVILASNSTSTNTFTPPSGFTETADMISGPCPIELCYEQQSTAGATGNLTVTSSGTGQGITTFLALNPTVSPTNATGSFTAYDATTTSSGGGTTSAPAGNATGQFTANDAIVSISNPTALEAVGQFTANDATVQTSSLFQSIVIPGHTNIVPGLAVRIRATYNGNTYPVWWGNIDAWDINYFPPNYSQANIQATDATKRVSLVKRVALSTAPVGAGEDTGARIARILDSAGFPALDRVIAVGDSTLQATDLSGNAWDEILVAAQSEGGEVFVDPAGRVVFKNRRIVLTDQRKLTPQAVFGDRPDLGELSIADLKVSDDRDNLINDIQATNNGGTLQESTDSTSVDQYGWNTFPMTGLMLQTDSEAANLAGWVLTFTRGPEQRISSLTIDPRRDPANLFPVILSLGYGDRIRVNLTAPGGGPRSTWDLFIRGIQHDINAPAQTWITTYQTQSASKFQFWTLEDPTKGVIGTPLSW